MSLNLMDLKRSFLMKIFFILIWLRILSWYVTCIICNTFWEYFIILEDKNHWPFDKFPKMFLFDIGESIWDRYVRICIDRYMWVSVGAFGISRVSAVPTASRLGMHRLVVPCWCHFVHFGALRYLKVSESRSQTVWTIILLRCVFLPVFLLCVVFTYG